MWSSLLSSISLNSFARANYCSFENYTSIESLRVLGVWDGALYSQTCCWTQLSITVLSSRYLLNTNLFKLSSSCSVLVDSGGLDLAQLQKEKSNDGISIWLRRQFISIVDWHTEALLNYTMIFLKDICAIGKPEDEEGKVIFSDSVEPSVAGCFDAQYMEVLLFFIYNYYKITLS